MLKDSIIFYASDNGGCFKSGGYNNPYRGTKSTNFEGGVKTPAFLYVPGVEMATSTSSSSLSNPSNRDLDKKEVFKKTGSQYQGYFM